ncbi:MAG: hypothetical protein QFB86_04630 [Patescibacteria group bacterium]|nr:hypothetical protein [Patescibacteria group bacterium]
MKKSTSSLTPEITKVRAYNSELFSAFTDFAAQKVADALDAHINIEVVSILQESLPEGSTIMPSQKVIDGFRQDRVTAISEYLIARDVMSALLGDKPQSI